MSKELAAQSWGLELNSQSPHKMSDVVMHAQKPSSKDTQLSHSWGLVNSQPSLRDPRPVRVFSQIQGEQLLRRKKYCSLTSRCVYTHTHIHTHSKYQRACSLSSLSSFCLSRFFPSDLLCLSLMPSLLSPFPFPIFILLLVLKPRKG